MNINPDILRRDTVQLIREIEKQIHEVELVAEQMGTKSHKLRDRNGNWCMSPLLLAKAQAYATLVQLQDKKH